jgi:AP-1 complex subunit mu
MFTNLYFQGGKEYLMRAQFKLPSVDREDQDAKPPIEVKFEIPYFTTSGIQVNQLISNFLNFRII